MQTRIVTLSSYGLGILIAVVSGAGLAAASPAVGAPEIDGSSMSAGLGLLAAGILLLKARKSR